MQNEQTELQMVLESKKPKQIYEYALNNAGAPVDMLYKELLKTGDRSYLLLFALKVPGAPVLDVIELVVGKSYDKFIRLPQEAGESFANDLSVAISNTDNPQLIYWFSTHFAYAQNDILCKKIVKIGNAQEICWFALNAINLSQENINELAEAIAQTDDRSYINYFLTYVPNAPKKLLQDAIVRLGGTIEK